MLGPHAPYERHSFDEAKPTHLHPSTTPSGTTGWWVVKAFVVVATMMLGCVGFAGALERSQDCREISKRACLTLVVGHLTGTAPPPPGD